MADGNEGNWEESIGKLADTVDKLVSNQSQMQEAIGSITQVVSQGLLGSGEKESKTPVSKEPVDLEGMSRAEFSQFLTSNILDALEENYVKPLQEEVKGVKSSTQKLSVQEQLKDAQGKHKDFDRWIEEIKVIAQNTPGISPEDAYHLARAKNPEKVGIVEKELGMSVETPEAVEPPKPKFFALNPSVETSTEEGSEDEPKGPKKSFIRKAAEKNLNEVLEDF